MKKNTSISFVVIVFAIAFFFFKKESPPLENKIVLFNNFEASLDFKMNSLGEYKMGNADGIVLKTELLGKPIISFSKEENLMKVTWDPSVVLTVNNVVKNEYASEFSSVTQESFYLHFSNRMIMDKIYFIPRANISPEVQELVLNFNKMLAHQLAWFFVLAPTEKISTIDGVDIWGENNQDINHLSDKISIMTRSKEGHDNNQLGSGNFELQRLKEGGIIVSGLQESILGDKANPNASTKNSYEMKTLSYKDLPELRFNLKISDYHATPPWIVVDAKALKAAGLREKLKGWNLEKLKAALFNYKVKKNATYKDIAELSNLLENMLFMNNSLASEYYAWALKLGPKHPLYDEIIKSLSLVGCADCQKYLVKIVEDFKTNKEASQKALLGIGFLETPLETTEEGLHALGEDTKFSNHELAQYMLGTMASKLEETSPERALKIDSEYSEKLKTKPSVSDLRHNLTVLGNSGVCSDYSGITKLINHSDLDVQKDAVLALRFCKNEKVPNLYWSLFETKIDLQSTVLQAMDMRLQKEIYDQSLFDEFREWLLENSPKADDNLKKNVVAYLRSFSLRGQEYKDQFNELAKDCLKNKICYYFNQ